ncbi:MAG: FAD-dependent thymidylate synthase, partial [Lachnospirales bacterium]
DEGRSGLARELARMNLTANIYTQWYWKVDLHNLFHFLSLRADPHAQYEIRVYADAICELTKAWVPAAYEAFEDFRLGGAHLSRAGREAVRRMIAGETLDADSAGMSPAEWRELMAAIG